MSSLAHAAQVQVFGHARVEGSGKVRRVRHPRVPCERVSKESTHQGCLRRCCPAENQPATMPFRRDSGLLELGHAPEPPIGRVKDRRSFGGGRVTAVLRKLH